MPLSRRQLLHIALGSATALFAGRTRSAPVARADHLHWLATADSGSGDRHQIAVGSAMAALHRRHPADLVLLGGDNIYNDGDIRLVERAFRRPYQELLAAGVPFHAVLGNHDIRTDGGAGQLAYPGFGMKGRWYTLRRGPVQFFLIDTNVDVPWQHQMPWLRKNLAESTAPWKVVVGHHPIYSSGFYGDDPVAQRRLGSHFQRHGVQLYINGHDHHYERSTPIHGTTYLTVGNGGASLRPVLAGANTARAVSTFGFTSLKADATGLTIQAWDTAGKRLDQARLALNGSLQPL
ncbi:MAG: metallophosphoesterase [Cyanobium sp.]